MHGLPVRPCTRQALSRPTVLPPHRRSGWGAERTPESSRPGTANRWYCKSAEFFIGVTENEHQHPKQASVVPATCHPGRPDFVHPCRNDGLVVGSPPVADHRTAKLSVMGKGSVNHTQCTKAMLYLYLEAPFAAFRTFTAGRNKVGILSLFFLCPRRRNTL